MKQNKRALSLRVTFAILLGMSATITSYAEDTAVTRSLEGVEQARPVQLIVNQVDTSKFPEVNIFATALKGGNPVANLTSNDFKVREDEVEQGPITVTPKLNALSAVVTLDTSGSMSKAIETAKSAATSFVGRLDPKDEISIVGFARTVQTLSGFTPDKATSRGAISSTIARGDTALYDGIYHSLELLKTRQGRKAVVVLSDGKDDDGTGKPLSKKTLDDVLALAKEVNVPIFTIGLGSEIDRPSLQRIATQTGGLFQEAPTAEDLGKLYEGIGQQLSGQYNISYTSNLPGDGSIHRIQLGWEGVTSLKEYVSPAGKNIVALKTAAPAATPIVANLDAAPLDLAAGLTFDTATPIKASVLYFDKRVLAADSVRYVSLNVRSGKRYLAFVQITEQTNDWTKVDLFDGGREKLISYREHAQYPFESIAVTFAGVEAAAQPYYLAIKGKAPEYIAIFEYDTQDANSGRDAGAELAAALDLPLNTPVVGHFGMNDYWDTYKLSVEPSKKYLIKVRPSVNASVKLTVTDSDGVRIGTARSANAGALTKFEFTATTKVIEVSVGWDDRVPDNSAYGLVAGGVDVESPTQPSVPRSPALPKKRSSAD